MKPVLAWHFVTKNRRLGYNDGRIVWAGQKLTVEPPIVLCERGLHAGIKPLDALQYTSNAQIVACRVKLSGEIVNGTDKLVASERECLWWVDAETVLHEFACWCARRALVVAGVEDKRCWDAITTKLRWLHGEATGAELDAAWAAGAAAREAAWAREAARAAAWAARAATREAARGAQNRKLASMLTRAAKAKNK